MLCLVEFWKATVTPFATSISLEENAALFTQVIANGEIRNLGVLGTISGNGVAGLIHDANDIRIINSYFHGTLISSDLLNGGLTGTVTAADIDSYIIASYARGTLTLTSSNPSNGGLQGHISSSGGIKMSSSWAALAIAGAGSSTGGLLGSFGTSQPPTRNTFSFSYWDTEVSTRNFGIGSDDDNNDNVIDTGELPLTAGATGLTTSQMQANSDTYPNLAPAPMRTYSASMVRTIRGSRY